MVKFYYNDYPFRKDMRYLVLYRGGFSPSTRGHVSLVEKYIHMKNVKYYISQIGSPLRHGVPYYFNRKIWRIYIDELFDDYRDKIFLKKMKGTYDVLDYVEDIDVVIFLRGREEEENERENKEIERRSKYAALISKLRRRNVSLDFLIIDRPEIDTLSTTKFIEGVLNNKSIEELKFFLPDISSSTSRYIIRKLRTFDLK